MENENSIAPKRYIETCGIKANSKWLREIFDSHNIPLKIAINQRYWELGLNVKYKISSSDRLFYSKLGSLSIKFKLSLTLNALARIN